MRTALFYLLSLFGTAGSMALLHPHSFASTVFLGQALPEEASPRSNGAYLTPNELLPQNFESSLRNKNGALLSVGSFRAFNDAAYGDFSHLLFLDYDSLITEFNRTNAELIALSSDRYEYLSHLFGRRPSASLLAQARLGKMPLYDFLHHLEKSPAIAHSDEPAALQRYKTLASRTLRPNSSGAQAEPIFLARDTGELLYAFKEMSKKPSAALKFWESDTLFSKLQGTLKRVPVLFLSANLLGDQSISALAKVLRSQRIEVSAADLSNVIEYDSHLSPQKSLLKNLEQLPWAKDSRILFSATVNPHHILDEKTAGVSSPASLNELWHYFSADSETFLQALRDGHFENYDSMALWMKGELRGRRLNPLQYYALGKLSPRKSRCIAPLLKNP